MTDEKIRLENMERRRKSKETARKIFERVYKEWKLMAERMSLTAEDKTAPKEPTWIVDHEPTLWDNDEFWTTTSTMDKPTKKVKHPARTAVFRAAGAHKIRVRTNGRRKLLSSEEGLL